MQLMLGWSLLVVVRVVPVASPASGFSGACCPWFWQLPIGLPSFPLALGHCLVIVGGVGGGVHFLYGCHSVLLARQGYSLSPPGCGRYGR